MRRSLLVLGVVVLILGVALAVLIIAFDRGWLIRTESVEVTFERLTAATVVEVRIGSLEAMTISDRDRVRAAALEVQRHRGTYEVPWAGPPVGRVHTRFIGEDGRAEGAVEIGRGFLVAHHAGYFYSRRISDHDLDRLLEVIGLTRQDLERR